MNKISASFEKLVYTKAGKPMSLYGITAISPEDLQRYKEIKGNAFQLADSGLPAFFTTLTADQEIQLKFGSNGELYPDTSERDRLLMRAKSLGTNVETAIANKLAESLLGDLGISKPKANAQLPEPAPEEDDKDLGKL